MAYLIGEASPFFRGMGCPCTIAGSSAGGSGTQERACAVHFSICCPKAPPWGRSITERVPSKSPPMYSCRVVPGCQPGRGPLRLLLEMTPLALVMSNCFPSGVTRRQVGYHPDGMNPRLRALVRSLTSKTDTVLILALDTKRSFSSGLRASELGVFPAGVVAGPPTPGERVAISSSSVRPVAVSITETEFRLALATKSRVPSLVRSISFGCSPVDHRADTFHSFRSTTATDFCAQRLTNSRPLASSSSIFRGKGCSALAFSNRRLARFVMDGSSVVAGRSGAFDSPDPSIRSLTAGGTARRSILDRLWPQRLAAKMVSPAELKVTPATMPRNLGSRTWILRWFIKSPLAKSQRCTTSSPLPEAMICRPSPEKASPPNASSTGERARMERVARSRMATSCGPYPQCSTAAHFPEGCSAMVEGKSPSTTCRPAGRSSH